MVYVEDLSLSGGGGSGGSLLAAGLGSTVGLDGALGALDGGDTGNGVLENLSTAVLAIVKTIIKYLPCGGQGGSTWRRWQQQRRQRS